MNLELARSDIDLFENENHFRVQIKMKSFAMSRWKIRIKNTPFGYVCTNNNWYYEQTEFDRSSSPFHGHEFFAAMSISTELISTAINKMAKIAAIRICIRPDVAISSQWEIIISFPIFIDQKSKWATTATTIHVYFAMDMKYFELMKWIRIFSLWVIVASVWNRFHSFEKWERIQNILSIIFKIDQRKQVRNWTARVSMLNKTFIYYYRMHDWLRVHDNHDWIDF